MKMKIFYSKFSKTNLALILFSFLATITIFWYWEVLCNNFLYYSEKYSPNFSNSSISISSQKDDLQEALEKASMGNKTLIIAFVNKAYVEPHEDEYPSMFDLFLEGFWVGEDTRQLVDHLLVVSMDKAAYERCRFRRLNCYRLAAEDGGGEKVYMSEEFIQMMWRRTLFLLHVLRRGYNFVFTDTDVMWLRNPLRRLVENTTLDLQISTDSFNGDPFSDKHPINTGFYFIRSNSKTSSLFRKWYDSSKNSTGMKEQDVLQNLVTEKGVLKELNLNARFLDTLYFSGFCSDSQDIGSVATVHANCCRTIKAKVVDLKRVLMDWKRFKALNGTNGAFPWSEHKSCLNSWHS